MRRAILLAMLVGLMIFTVAPAASAHVHGVTPLSCAGVGSANSGGNGTNDTPAAGANGGPITGLIPRDVGSSPLEIGDGGFRPVNNPHC